MSGVFASYPIQGGGGGGGSGTVTSVGLSDGSSTPIYTISGSPVTTSGTLTFTLHTQSANLVFAGPTTGSAAQPSFRSLVASDIPSLSGTYLVKANNLSDVASASTSFANISPLTTAGDIIYENASPTPARLPIGSSGNVLTVSGGFPAWAPPATSGTVTSVAMTVPTFLSVSGSPITSSGTLAVTLSGTALPILNGGTGNTTASAAFAALSPLTTAGDIIYENATPTPARLAIGSTGNVLTVSGGLPVWSPPATSGTVTSVAMTVPTFLSVSGSPVTSSGTLAVSLSGTALPIANGGTGQITAAAAFNALNPMTTTGDIIYESGTNTASRLAIGSSGNVLTVTGGVPVWAAPSGGGGNDTPHNIVSNYTGTTSDGFNFITVTTGTNGANIVYTLPSASANSGRQIKITKIDTDDHHVSFAATSGTVFGQLGNIAGGGNGQAQCTYLFAQNASIIFESDGSNWYSLTVPVSAVTANPSFTWNGGTGGTNPGGTCTMFVTRTGNLINLYFSNVSSMRGTSGVGNTSLRASYFENWVNNGNPNNFPVSVESNGVLSLGSFQIRSSGNGFDLFYDSTQTTVWPSSLANSGIGSEFQVSYYAVGF